MEVVFNTEAEAETQQALDLACYLEHHNTEPYKSQTTRWDVPKERLDGKWAYNCCPMQDYSGMIVEPYDESNYPNFDSA
jgi:hypothetical protein